MMIRIQSHLSLSALDGESVLLDSRSGRYYSLNATGARMLAILSETGDPDAVVPRMACEYDADPERIREDWDRLYRDFLARGFLVREE